MINYNTLRFTYNSFISDYDLIIHTCYSTIQASGVVPRGHAVTPSRRQHQPRSHRRTCRRPTTRPTEKYTLQCGSYNEHITLRKLQWVLTIFSQLLTTCDKINRSIIRWELLRVRSLQTKHLPNYTQYAYYMTPLKRALIFTWLKFSFIVSNKV